MSDDTKLTQDQFTGDAMSRVAFSPTERAQIREMFTKISEEWPNIEAGGSVIRAVFVIYQVLRYGGLPALFLAGLGAFAKTNGWL